MSNTKKATAPAAPAEETSEIAAEAVADVQEADADLTAEVERDAIDDEIAALEAELERRRAPVVLDPREQYLAELRAQLATGPAAPAEPADPRDAAIAALRAELDAVKSSPAGERDELRRALAALADTVNRMQSGIGLVPVGTPDGPEPYAYGVMLECGDLVETQHPNGTHHHCTKHGTVPVRSFFKMSEEMRREADERAHFEGTRV